MLLPREVDIAAVGREAPLPVPRPKIAAVEVMKEDGQGREGLDGARVTTARRTPSPVRIPNAAVGEVKKSGEVKPEAANKRNGSLPRV
jgi:hypothetical protein